MSPQGAGHLPGGSGQDGVVASHLRCAPIHSRPDRPALLMAVDLGCKVSMVRVARAPNALREMRKEQMLLAGVDEGQGSVCNHDNTVMGRPFYSVPGAERQMLLPDSFL